MTEILERRWKCDYCGCVSPVLSYDMIKGTEHPRGWTNVKGYNYWTFPKEDVLYHFCCGHHEILWKSKRAESAKTPEEAKA